MGTYSNLGYSEPTPADPAVANAWGVILNTNFTLIDSSVAGILPLTVTSADVVLTVANGAADQSRNAHFLVTGALTGNRQIFFPSNRTIMMSVSNNTTGVYSLTVAVGTVTPLGTTVAIPQNGSLLLVSDGTNISQRVDKVGLGVGTGTGSVTSVATGAGLTGGPITTTGTVSIAVIAGVAGTYTNASISVNNKGQVTAAASGTGTKRFVSALQTITSAGSLTIPHGLGAVPIIVLAYLQCTSAELNYSVGNIVPIAINPGNTGGAAWPLTVEISDGINLKVRYGITAPSIGNFSTGSGANITITNWKMYLFAQA